jgi:hypothetical protein
MGRPHPLQYVACRRSACLPGLTESALVNPAWREELAYWMGQGVCGMPWLIAQLGHPATAYLNLGKPPQRSDREMLMCVSALLVSINNDDIYPSQ